MATQPVSPSDTSPRLTTEVPANLGTVRTHHVVKVRHDLASDTSDTITDSITIGPSGGPTHVYFVSTVEGTPPRAGQSPAFTAAIRRRGLKPILVAVKELANQADRADFAVAVFPIAVQIDNVLFALQDAETEGNTREALRRIRNTLRNGGHDAYKAAPAREATADLLLALSSAEVVGPELAEEAFDRLSTAGLSLIPAPLWTDDHEFHEQDDEAADVLG